MTSTYKNYQANTTFRSTSFGNVSGLGTSARTASAIILGGPRAGAGSAFRIYNYFVNNDPRALERYLSNVKAINKANAYFVNNYTRNHIFYL
jgi:hypothetical protein